MTTPTATRLDELAQQIQLDMAEEYRLAAQEPDPAKMIEKIRDVQSRMNDKTQERYDKEVADKAVVMALSEKAAEGFQVDASGKLKAVWKELNTAANKLTHVPMYIFRVERGEDGNLAEPTFIIGKVTKLPRTNPAAKKNFMVKFHGTEYASIAQAWKVLMTKDGVVLPAPSKSAGGREAYSKLECLPIMKEAGHKLEV